MHLQAYKQTGKLKHKNSFILKGFTLAEILLTLTIIGVIASLTIPNLILSVQNQQYGAALRKNYSILSQATLQILDAQGGTFLGKFNDANDVLAAYKPYFKAVKTCSRGNATGSGRCFANVLTWLNGNTYTYMAGLSSRSAGMILIDGTSILIYGGLIGETATCTVDSSSDICFSFMIDINGFNKGPNIFGRDIFNLMALHNRLVPSRNDVCIYPPNAGWNGATNYGYGCFIQMLNK